MIFAHVVAARSIRSVMGLNKTMLPEVIIRRSWLYDESLVRTGKYKLRPADTVLNKAEKRLIKEWNKYGRKILQTISTMTRLKWQEREIVCYLTWGVIPYSDPVTLNLRSDIDTLTHELIHRIISEPKNRQLVSKNWQTLMKRYKNESRLTKVHIVVHAIHYSILDKLFDKKRLQQEMNKVKSKDYIRAWDIVKRDDHREIIKIFTKGLR